jgi:hypothetical protein
VLVTFFEETNMLRHIRCAAVIATAAASLAIGGAAHATTISGSATFADTTNSNDLTVTDAFGGTGNNGGTFTLNGVTVGGSAQTYSDFLTLGTQILSNQTETVSDDVAVTFAITQPGTGNGSLGGGVTEVQTVHGRFNQSISNSSTVTWDDPLTIALSNGDNLIINLADTDLTNTECDHNADVCGNVNATFQLTDPSPAPVPEAATLALLGSGLLGLGFVGLRKRR